MLVKLDSMCLLWQRGDEVRSRFNLLIVERLGFKKIERVNDLIRFQAPIVGPQILGSVSQKVTFDVVLFYVLFNNSLIM